MNNIVRVLNDNEYLFVHLNRSSFLPESSHHRVFHILTLMKRNSEYFCSQLQRHHGFVQENTFDVRRNLWSFQSVLRSFISICTIFNRSLHNPREHQCIVSVSTPTIWHIIRIWFQDSM